LENVDQSRMRKNDILGTVGNTPLVEIARMCPNPEVRIFAKLEGSNPTGSVKDRIAKYMMTRAVADGKLTPDKVILEPTSGNTGISLAFVARRMGYRVKVVMPENVSAERTQLLEAYGAEIVFSDGAGGTNGAIVVAQEMAAKDDTYFMLYQYGNEANPLAHYETTGVEILQDLPEVDTFVAGLGTGGTLMGVGRRLKEEKPGVKVVAVVPHPEDAIQGLRSLEDGFIPPILDLSILDSRIMVEGREAFRVTRELMQKEGIFAGISSGAVVCCAVRLAERMERGNIVCLLADGGWKYLSTSLWTKDFSELQDSVESKIWW
jgi:cysteine synthase